MDRRTLLKLGLAGGAATLLPVGQAIRTFASGGFSSGRIPESPPVPSFAVPLGIPPELQPVRSEGNTDYFLLTQQINQVQILPTGPKTTIWGYNGITPGPTIRQNRNRDHVVRQVNHLEVPVTVHLHGGDVRPEDDGHPTALIQPGGYKDYHYPGLHPSAPLWYHDHSIHETGRNVWMGLAGQYPIVSDEELALPLPKGKYEVPLTIQDRFFLADNSIVYPTDGGEPFRQGVFGDVILVNGTPKPFFQVGRRKYLFRILNGSNARVYRLQLSTGEPFIGILAEGGFYPHPVPLPDITLMPSNRIGVVVDFSQYQVGQQIVLRNIFEDVPGDPYDEAKTREIMRFDVVDDATDPTSIPNDLPSRVEPSEAEAVLTRDWRFERQNGAWAINKKLWDENRIDAFPKLGTVEVWRFVNSSGGWIHPIHPHLVEFRILDRNGLPPRPEEGGPMDTAFLGRNEEVRVVMRFEHFKGIYAFHCHNVEHEDNDMMTQFQVV